MGAFYELARGHTVIIGYLLLGTGSKQKLHYRRKVIGNRDEQRCITKFTSCIRVCSRSKKTHDFLDILPVNRNVNRTITRIAALSNGLQLNTVKLG